MSASSVCGCKPNTAYGHSTLGMACKQRLLNCAPGQDAAAWDYIGAKGEHICHIPDCASASERGSKHTGHTDTSNFSQRAVYHVVPTLPTSIPKVLSVQACFPFELCQNLGHGVAREWDLTHYLPRTFTDLNLCDGVSPEIYGLGYGNLQRIYVNRVRRICHSTGVPVYQDRMPDFSATVPT
jgi:hypothetical protein